VCRAGARCRTDVFLVRIVILLIFTETKEKIHKHVKFGWVTGSHGSLGHMGHMGHMGHWVTWVTGSYGSLGHMGHMGHMGHWVTWVTGSHGSLGHMGHWITWVTGSLGHMGLVRVSNCDSLTHNQVNRIPKNNISNFIIRSVGLLL